jgi:hypothetical protein
VQAAGVANRGKWHTLAATPWLALPAVLTGCGGGATQPLTPAVGWRQRAAAAHRVQPNSGAGVPGVAKRFQNNGALKQLFFFGAKSKIGIFACFFLCKTNSYSCPGWFCWPIGVTAALLGGLLPSDGPKLVKKKKEGICS